MIRFPLAFAASLPALLVASPALAADRTYSVGSFDRIRIDGPFRVELTVGKSPGATAQGDTRNTDRLNIRVEGDTLIVSASSTAWQEQANTASSNRSPAATIIRASTPRLRSATVYGGGQLSIAGPMRAQRVDLSVRGTGSLDVRAIDADQLIADVSGPGTMTLAGKAAKARISGNGPTRILAEKLVANDLSIRTDGNGETIARARFTTTVNAAGVGAVTVYGKPTCIVNKNVQGPVSCGELLVP
ncbi:DUF2807 domain-containing protein [Sphingomonas aliaeris]|uniref:DUF2807 domain-containing protein n=1 Tax=Sphingomonas aliaeris TaxID=2759526 RepID=A0A974S4V5_9SPHN|nr:DUF2807 domain-containing protein [Sphingomonas aliaeris]QQV77440.1 DUF2807 domain-containing protein [Sphingomonas aliaeris]